MKSGVFYGNAALLDGMLDRMEEEMGQKLTVIATGGLARSLIPHCRHHIILDDELLLKGLKIIYEKNQQTIF
jgi:type III pantothenate kinase